ncbi:LysR family transcriptional regulator [Gottfriedia acidiceleris]|uniref:LysR family transcriptional regulator n=1 Tax=Bacillaceae TaxID=186817 RepID=UPI000BEE0848|nr:MULTISPECIES: LysR family transcriptional regulator [unclassified Bacillus (in: firmicutes)]PEC49180.1 LysR family transcriptional regulator [Bacillus sp. AFS096315]PFM75400.1 LysR family transcriptional regulator [Bacillus sp. AFS077874]
MELRELEFFIAICEELHFTRAAEKLGISQPALSRQIIALEDKLGVRLFDRLGKKIAITEAGKILQEESEKIFTNIKYIYEQIGELQKVKRGNLIIGAMSEELSQLASVIFLELHRMYPYLQMKIIMSDNIEDRVIQNEIDIALTHMPLENEQLTNIPLYNEEFYLVVPFEHHLAEREKVDFEEIKDIQLVLSPKNHNCRKLIDDAATSMGFVFKPIIELTDVNSILSIVKAGIGATILPNTLLTSQNSETLKVIKIVNPVITKEIAIVHHKEKYIGSAARNFIDLLVAYVNLTSLYEKDNEIALIHS